MDKTLRYYTHSKLFWPSVIMISFSLSLIGLVLRVDFLQYPYVLLILGTLPMVGIASMSVPIASLYVRIHVRLFHGTNTKYDKASNGSLSIPQFRSMLTSTVISIFGIMYLLISSIPFIGKNTGSEFLFLVLSLLICLLLSPALNMSAWILKKSGVIYENQTEGTRTNLGIELRNRLEWTIGPIAAARFVYHLVTTYPNIGIGLAFITFALIVSIPAITLSLFLLKGQLPKLSTKLDVELEKILIKRPE